jgi:hypothetical protein
VKVFRCQAGHVLNTLHSYRRTTTGRRLCKRCIEQRAQARKSARRPAMTPERAERNRLAYGRLRAHRERIALQLLACAESFRIQTEQAKGRIGA